MLNTINRYAKSVSLARPGAASTINGYRVPAADTNSTILAAIQPLSSKELRNVPEGQNTLEWKNIWSGSELKVKDKITSNLIIYTIQKVEYWEEGSFYHAQAVKVTD